MFEKLLPYEAAYLILDSYIHYHHQFKRITKRAKIRFELRDWHGIQNDTRERLTLYRDAVGRADLEGDQGNVPGGDLQLQHPKHRRNVFQFGLPACPQRPERR
ncbi:MAG: bifunctional isocitrate dehydrogenase kinase/phosphatase [Haliscomenobacter sp.]|nr:bifunctional isocitrate dehydrogenase kinase/phosphatase [Haliscomenobacter sp.]